MSNKSVENANRTASGVESEVRNSSIPDHTNPVANELWVASVESVMNEVFLGGDDGAFCKGCSISYRSGMRLDRMSEGDRGGSCE